MNPNWTATREWAYANARQLGLSDAAADKHVTSQFLALRHFAALEEHLRLIAQERKDAALAQQRKVAA